MRKDLLLKLADLLEADAAKPDGIKFDLRAWAYDANVGTPEENMLSPGQDVTLNCNTAACAMGLAALSGIFKEEGLTWEINLYNNMGIRYEGWANYDAAAKLFDIGSGSACYLFCPDEYPLEMRKGAEAERFVAKRIREFVGA